MTAAPTATSDVGCVPTPRSPLGWSAFAVLVFATIGERTLTLWHPESSADDTYHYDAVAPIRDIWWACHFFGGIALVMQSVAFVVAVCLLARSRGAIWALAGATTYVLGAAAFSVGIAAEGVAFAYATDPDAVPPAQGAALLAYMGEHADRYVVGVLPGLALISLGAIALCIALLRARTVHWIIPTVLLAGTLANLVLPFGLVAFLISTTTTTIPMLATGWYAARMR